MTKREPTKPSKQRDGEFTKRGGRIPAGSPPPPPQNKKTPPPAPPSNKKK